MNKYLLGERTLHLHLKMVALYYAVTFGPPLQGDCEPTVPFLVWTTQSIPSANRCLWSEGELEKFEIATWKDGTQGQFRYGYV